MPSKPTQYTLVKLPIRELIRQHFDVRLTREQEIDQEYLISQGASLIFDQIERLRGKAASHISEVILVEARKNPKQEQDLLHILTEGFYYNGVHYARFGKSASQGKAGITAFVCDSIFDELYRITQMDIPVSECVISKYEAQRGLLFSSCTLIHNYMPHIVIIGEYEKVLPRQFIKYVTEREREYTDQETGERKKYTAREIAEGCRDIRLSPFDGCGCHEHEFMEQVSGQLGLDYAAIGAQVRLPFMKGYSVYVPFRAILKEWGCESVTDIYGTSHPVDTIDCIWNISMFKGHKLFTEAYGQDAWTEYCNTLMKYSFKLGISKYSHHVRHLNRYTRMNFQYLQCLDLWNPQYIASYENRELDSYDILDPAHAGKIIRLAQYTTDLYEKIIKGDPFYTCKFMGITDADDTAGSYLEAVRINRRMLRDPAVKQFVYRKLKKAIDDAKTGKIYCSGFYHTGIGDMIGYLQYAAGKEVTGCLKKGELYSGNYDCGDIISFRSPLVDPSEVNKIKIARNDLIDRWFGYFKDQDVVMFNMYDMSAPQQGGADFDGDIFFLCNDPSVIASKIEKTMILDMEDKATALSKPYVQENIAAYEMMTRDNRIGEITNVATSIENRYTSNEEIRALYSDYASLLRVFQGKEIDFLKTGVRWHMNSGLRKHLRQLPYFLLFHYPGKRETYRRLAEKNKAAGTPEEKVPLNAYHSPSPMNELCHYICTWEKKHVLWDKSPQDLADTKDLILGHTWDISDKQVCRTVRRCINAFADEIRKTMELHSEKSGDENQRFHMKKTVQQFRERLSRELQLEEEHIANYVIHISYASRSISKALAWAAYGDYIIGNLKKNSPPGTRISITELPDAEASYHKNVYEYLGKYYEYTEEEEHR